MPNDMTGEFTAVAAATRPALPVFMGYDPAGNPGYHPSYGERLVLLTDFATGDLLGLYSMLFRSGGEPVENARAVVRAEGARRGLDLPESPEESLALFYDVCCHPNRSGF